MEFTFKGPIWDVLRKMADDFEKGRQQPHDIAVVAFKNQPYERSLFIVPGVDEPVAPRTFANIVCSILSDRQDISDKAA